MYEQIRFEIRDGMIEIVNRYPSRNGAPGEKRDKKRRVTPEEMEKQNIRQREKKVQRLIAANFREGDFHLILKYHEKPATFEQAKENFQRFLEKMRKTYKKAGYIFKYIGVTERGKRRGALHHHLIIENIQSQELDTVRTVRALWSGHCAWHDLYKEGAYANLASYIVKKESKEENSGCTYTRSRNLRIPKEKKVVYRRKKWPEEPKAGKGWYIVKDSVVDGVNAFTGYPYQCYLTEKVKTEEEREAERLDYAREGSKICTKRELISISRRGEASKQKTGGTATSSSTSHPAEKRKRVRDSVRKRKQRRRDSRLRRSNRRCPSCGSPAS